MIGDIDTLVASVDSDWQHVKRSFCVLELYAAVPFRMQSVGWQHESAQVRHVHGALYTV